MGDEGRKAWTVDALPSDFGWLGTDRGSVFV